VCLLSRARSGSASSRAPPRSSLRAAPTTCTRVRRPCPKEHTCALLLLHSSSTYEILRRPPLHACFPCPHPSHSPRLSPSSPAGQELPISDEFRAKFEEVYKEIAGQGERVLGFARLYLPLDK
jgi:hypothetical protein